MRDILRDFVLFADADKYVGRVDSFTPPTLAVTEEDFRAAGMDCPVGLDMGMEKMECSFTMSGIERSILTRFGLEIGQRSNIRCRGGVHDVATGLIKPVHHICTGNIRSIEQGEWTPGSRATLNVSMTLIHYKLTHTVPGVPAIEIDALNGIRLINGVDQLAAVRAATGR